MLKGWGRAAALDVSSQLGRLGARGVQPREAEYLEQVGSFGPSSSTIE